MSEVPLYNRDGGAHTPVSRERAFLRLTFWRSLRKLTNHDCLRRGHRVQNSFNSITVLYRGTSLIRTRRPLGPCSRAIPWAL
jgi:hypothetical protein